MALVRFDFPNLALAANRAADSLIPYTKVAPGLLAALVDYPYNTTYRDRSFAGHQVERALRKLSEAPPF